MFNSDFFPTPIEVIQYITSDLNLHNKVVLEPSAGSGNILDYISSQGAETLACELDPKLAEIAKIKCDRFICNDFLQVTSEQISHVDYIVMNPPFSSDEKHILYAWEIAPQGCIIKALCNWETLDNRYSGTRRELNQIISEFGYSENLGECFSTSERKTNVEVGLVVLHKPKSGDDEFEDFFDLTEDYQTQENGLIGYNEIQDIVNRYVGCVKMYDEVIESSAKINLLASPFGSFNNIHFGAYTKRDNHFSNITRDVYKKELQKSAWKTVFSKMKLGKYVTKSVLEKLNRFVEKQTNVPFKLQNVYRMVDMIVQTYSQNMDQAILDVFGKITKHYSENRHMVEGWKTNSQYMINEKMIFPGIVKLGWSGEFDIHYQSRNVDLVNDLNKALCYITGNRYDEMMDINSWERAYPTILKLEQESGIKRESYESYSDFGDRLRKNGFSTYDVKPDKIEFGKWYDWFFFEIKGYKKGTMHMKFKNRDHWALLNQKIAKMKGWGLPEKF